MDPSLDIFNKINFDNSIVKQETHVYLPTTQNFKNNDEVRIAIQHQELLTLPASSFVRVEYTLEFPAGSTGQIANNSAAFLFDEIRYELNGVEIDRAKDVGMLTLAKGLLTYSPALINSQISNSWSLTHDGLTFDYSKSTENVKKTFYAQLPLKLLFGFAEDYNRAIVNLKQELILIRSRSDKDLVRFSSSSSHEVKVSISTIEWHIDHIEVSDEVKLPLYQKIMRDAPIMIPFRRFELHELPSLRITDRDVWNVKTSTSLERPRFVILAFQTQRRDDVSKDVDYFDHCDMRNIKIYLNSNVYPYNNLNLNIEADNYALVYQMYCDFQTKYYANRLRSEPCLTFKEFKERMLFVFDVSKQDDGLNSTAIDLKVELEANKAFKEGTRGYCIIICDNIVEYTPLSGIIRKIVQ